MVEWGRLLSGYRGEILGRRFESCPPRHMRNAFHKERVLLSVSGPPQGMIFESCRQVPATKNTPENDRRVLFSVARSPYMNKVTVTLEVTVTLFPQA